MVQYNNCMIGHVRESHWWEYPEESSVRIVSLYAWNRSCRLWRETSVHSYPNAPSLYWKILHVQLWLCDSDSVALWNGFRLLNSIYMQEDSKISVSFHFEWKLPIDDIPISVLLMFLSENRSQLGTESFIPIRRILPFQPLIVTARIDLQRSNQ